MSIAAPATNPASDLELKLPATVGTAGQVLRNTATPGTLEFGAGVFGATETQGYQNLKIYCSANNNTAITADSVILESTTGVCLKASSVSLTLDCTTTGVNALDTGSLAAEKPYYVWIISNGSTTASVASLSGTSPTLPSGYTYKARVGAVTTGFGSTNLNVSQQVNTKHQTVEGNKTLIHNASGAVSNLKKPMPMVSKYAATYNIYVSCAGGTAAGTTEHFTVSGGSSTFSRVQGDYHVTANGIGDMRYQFDNNILFTIDSGVPQTYFTASTNFGPNWWAYLTGWSY